MINSACHTKSLMHYHDRYPKCLILNMTVSFIISIEHEDSLTPKASLGHILGFANYIRSKKKLSENNYL